LDRVRQVEQMDERECREGERGDGAGDAVTDDVTKCIGLREGH